MKRLEEQQQYFRGSKPYWYEEATLSGKWSGIGCWSVKWKGHPGKGKEAGEAIQLKMSEPGQSEKSNCTGRLHGAGCQNPRGRH